MNRTCGNCKQWLGYIMGEHVGKGECDANFPMWADGEGDENCFMDKDADAKHCLCYLERIL